MAYLKKLRQSTLIGITLWLVISTGCTNAASNAESEHLTDDQNALDQNSQGNIEPLPIAGDLPKASEVGAPSCLPSAPVSVEMDQVSELGFAPDDIVALAMGTYETTMVWADGPSGPAKIVVTLLSQDARVIHFEAADSREGPIAEIACLDHMELPVEAEIVTDDGRLNRKVGAALVATSADRAELSIELERESFESILAELGVERFKEVRLRLDLEFSSDGLTGEISGIGTSFSNQADDNNGTVSAERFNIASF